MNWAVPKIWSGGDVWIIGGGASITKEFEIPDEVVLDVLNGKQPMSAYSPYMKFLHDKHVIAVNAAFMIGEWMDMVFFGDSKFFLKFKNQLYTHPKLKVSCAPASQQCPWVKYLSRDKRKPRGLTENRETVSWNYNSGGAAMTVAANAGAKRIFLLGFDMKLNDRGDQHFHSVYKSKRTAANPAKRKNLKFFQHLKSFPEIAQDAKRRGIEVYNVCPDSAILEFPRITLKQAIELSNNRIKPADLPPVEKPVAALPTVSLQRHTPPRKRLTKDLRILCFVNHYYNPQQQEGFTGGATVKGNENRETVVTQAITALRNIPNCDVRVCGLKGFTIPGVEVDIDFTGIKPWNLVYESLNYMNNFTNDYDYFINIEDDILLKENVIQNVIEFNRLRSIDEVFLPNRIEIEKGECRFVDLRGGWKKDSPIIIFKNRILKIANNYHSAILILSTRQYRYAYNMLDPNFREIWWGGPMASAYAYFHIPFQLYRNSQLTEYHSVEHMDHWKCYDDDNKDYLNLGKEKLEKAQRVIQHVRKRNATIEVKIPYGLNMDLAGAYNHAMEDSKTDWVLLLDHDVFVSCNPHWYDMCIEAVRTVSDRVGLITCVSNPRHNKNKGSQWADIIINSPDLDLHVQAAYELYQKYGMTLRRVTTQKVAGFFMLVRKSVWKDLKFRGVGKGVDLIDWDFCERLLKKGLHIYELPGLYVYHRRDVRKLDWGKPILESQNIEELPVKFGDWIHYYMKHQYPNHDYNQLINKHHVKSLVQPVVKVAKELAHFTDPLQIDEFDYSRLPKSFVIKATHGSHMNIIVKDGVEQISANQKQSRPFNLPEAKVKMKQWLETRFADGGELYYDEVDRGVLIEENLCKYFTDYEREYGIVDYKAWCFHGQIQFIATANYNGTKVNYYDTQWNELPFRRDDRTQLVKFPKPVNLEQMVKTVNRLLDIAGNPPFIRVDLYNFGMDTYFGEFTHSPGKGDKPFIPLDPKQPRDWYELEFGRAVANNSLTVVCFKWKHTVGEPLPAVARGIKYTADYVNKLYRAVERNLTIPHRFVCVTDDPEGIECETYPLWDWGREFGRCFTRLKMFDPAMRQVFGRRVLCIDLDTVVTGNLDNIFSRKEDFIIHTYYMDSHGYQQKYNGSLFMMDMGSRPEVYTQFDGQRSVDLLKKLQAEKKIIGSDQAWINYVLGDGEKRFGEEDGVYHLRNIMVPKRTTGRKRGDLPKNARLVMFSGNQDPSMPMYSKDLLWVQRNWTL
ncbi:MAG: ATP-grasp fold amidoligase family protein [Dehalococcoidales bacterium]